MMTLMLSCLRNLKHQLQTSQSCFWARTLRASQQASKETQMQTTETKEPPKNIKQR